MTWRAAAIVGLAALAAYGGVLLGFEMGLQAGRQGWVFD